VGDPQVVVNLDNKFGASLREAKRLLGVAQALKLSVVGVCFHVGSGCINPDIYTTAINMARDVFDHAAGVGMQLNVLDIGGGFPGHHGSAGTFEKVIMSEAFDISHLPCCARNALNVPTDGGTDKRRFGGQFPG
jgi:ornithine decarboxylase